MVMLAMIAMIALIAMAAFGFRLSASGFPLTMYGLTLFAAA
jgi:hypothetical protein